MRKTTALIAAFAVLASLTACTGSSSAGGSTISGCDSRVGSGGASSVVTATGSFGSMPQVGFPTPLYTSTTQKSELITGKGAPIQDGQPVLLEATILNGSTGKVVQQTSYASGGGSLLTVGKSVVPAVSKALRCATVGSRIAIVGSAMDSHQGRADAQSGIAKDDAFIYIIDVKSAFPARADGADQTPQNNQPAVVLTPNGTPGISVPAVKQPSSFSSEVLKAGSGKTVKAGDFVVLKYTGINWADKSIVKSTWASGQAEVLQLGAPTVVAGLSQGIAGRRVGSQVLLVLPPALTATPDGSGTAPANATLVYVVDVLGIAR